MNLKFKLKYLKLNVSDKKEKIKRTTITLDSNVVPHRSTNQARQCLTSLSRREAVLSLLYGYSCFQTAKNYFIKQHHLAPQPLTLSYQTGSVAKILHGVTCCKYTHRQGDACKHLTHQPSKMALFGSGKAAASMYMCVHVMC